MQIFKKYNIASNFPKYLFVVVFIALVLIPSPIVQACDPKTDPGCQPDGTIKNNKTPDSTITNSTKIDAHIENPLGDGISDIPSFIAKILEFILMLGVPIVALAIIYTGFLFVTALGNSEKLKKAKAALVYVIIGAALLLGAFVIAEAIKGTVVEISNEAKK